MILTNRERQAPTSLDEAEPSHLARYLFAAQFVHNGNVVLDVPCGSGYGTSVLARRARHAIGLDVHEGAIAHAKEFFFEPNSEFIAGDAERLSEILDREDRVDRVVSFEGVEHMQRPEVFLKEVHSVLSSNGQLIISTPRKPHGSPYHTIEFSLEEFESILQKQFTIETMYGQIYTDIFDLAKRRENPHAFPRFNCIAICRRR